MTEEQANILAAMMREKYPVLDPQALPFANLEHGYFVSFKLGNEMWLYDNFEDGVKYVEEGAVKT